MTEDTKFLGSSVSTPPVPFDPVTNIAPTLPTPNFPVEKVTKRNTLDHFLRFQRRVPIYFERGDFIVKTVENRKELLQAFRLRYDVFHREYIGKRFPLGIDTDRFDARADLLVILCKSLNRVVGTYRLISSNIANDYYSSTEFEIREFLASEGVKLELSRACIHRNFRKSVVLHLLWKGIARYMQKIGARYLFGCSSVQTTSLTGIKSVYSKLLESGLTSNDFSVRPTANYQVAGLGDYMRQQSLDLGGMGGDETQVSIPPLLQYYLRAGAKVYGEPALDSEFNCIDFFTVLDVSQLEDGYEKRYVEKCE